MALSSKSESSSLLLRFFKLKNLSWDTTNFILKFSSEETVHHSINLGDMVSLWYHLGILIIIVNNEKTQQQTGKIQ